MEDLFILKGKEIINELDIHRWSEFMSCLANRQIAKTIIPQPNKDTKDALVSTVFLGLDYNYGEGSPAFFETMVFGGSNHGYMERAPSFDEAIIVHNKTVKMIKED